MVYLITGPSHVGKTMLAQKLLEKYNIPYLSIDHLKMGLIRSKTTALTPYDDVELTEYLWPITEEIIKTVIENKQNIILEGCYVPPSWRNSFTDEYLSQISFICLVFTEEYIENNFTEITNHACDIEARIVDEITIEELIKNNNETAALFEKSGEHVYKIGDKYEDEVNKIIELLNLK